MAIQYRTRHRTRLISSPEWRQKYRTTMPSSWNRNRPLANASPQGDGFTRRCNLEWLHSRCTYSLSDGVRETLVYCSENGNCESVNKDG
jgi:hypothetical protein